ncbi:hypothetical protein ElyMa_006394500 [Elysia marginata]|uniref:Ig-like domain-containing protein n=1 Tax=Elysia marginata TaxID=1093978 RepID=A0AAV4HRZ0_9GAST|nr:hypothetical protein ElyMa_006394500 [Elysia marginata]
MYDSNLGLIDALAPTAFPLREAWLIPCCHYASKKEGVLWRNFGAVWIFPIQQASRLESLSKDLRHETSSLRCVVVTWYKLCFYQWQGAYGTSNSDPAQWKMGPNITYHSPTTLFFEIENEVFTPFVLDCQAVGNPRPTYRWFRQADLESSREEVTSALGERYAVTNGRLKVTQVP